MSFGGGEVDEAAFAEQADPAAVLEMVFPHKVARFGCFDGELFKRWNIDLDVEVARIANHGAVFHDLEVFTTDHALVAGDGNENVADPGGLGHRHHAIPIH